MKLERQGPNYRKVNEEVTKILRANFVIAPPVRIEEIAQNYGLKIVEADFKLYSDNVSGVIDLKTNTIYVNQNEPDVRQAFTIAHELAHYILHKSELEKDQTGKLSVLYRKALGELNQDPKEKEANCFAANLLVPAELLEKYKDYNIDTIAKIFGVSQEVIGYRLQFENGGKQRKNTATRI
ncbi:hypothetical protein A3A21_02165 [Candidatus Jorgensenbacteria bacterium RIFCSPLOWO2_01_FULL_45_25b]|uniref:IrrE N-terminal-like domain-containing protein n=1 Tax=Candidatus Jorgensenbacteria bacterium RIFCSPLOWO2_01_FULL_45_25b TaxID=1798471 RepID=A0A1F6BYX4_9BACT|nr:MAG: hypothetical protein A3A21_02165 [Candidatus Jorgensenbacteria bacterium RIFCSPLOWO2_01_FULL_45_25b]